MLPIRGESAYIQISRLFSGSRLLTYAESHTHDSEELRVVFVRDMCERIYEIETSLIRSPNRRETITGNRLRGASARPAPSGSRFQR